VIKSEVISTNEPFVYYIMKMPYFTLEKKIIDFSIYK
jgi:hypothetical protein